MVVTAQTAKMTCFLPYHKIIEGDKFPARKCVAGNDLGVEVFGQLKGLWTLHYYFFFFLRTFWALTKPGCFYSGPV